MFSFLPTAVVSLSRSLDILRIWLGLLYAQVCDAFAFERWGQFF